MTSHNGTMSAFQLQRIAAEAAQTQAMLQAQAHEQNRQMILTISNSAATLLAPYAPEERTPTAIATCAKLACDLVMASQAIFNQMVLAAKAEAEEKAKQSKDEPKVKLT